jgi:hypothetical protein
MKFGRKLAVALVAVVVGGCTPARLTVVPVSERARLEMGSTNGVPYYVPRPYLLVTRDVDITDDLLAKAGISADGPARGLAGSTSVPRAATTGTTSGTGNGATKPPASGVSGLEDTEAPRVKAVPSYHFKVIYLPDLARQYAIQQRGGTFNNYQVKYELENGWMFKGTELSSETKIAETIEASSSGIGTILGSSIEQIMSALFPIPVPDAGVSGVSGEAAADVGPKIWLFEISDGPQGTLRINTERPFFEWPRDEGRSRRGYHPPVESGRDPDAADLPSRPTGTPRPPAPTPAPLPRQPGPEAASDGAPGSSQPAPPAGASQPAPPASASQPSPSPGAVPPGAGYPP